MISKGKIMLFIRGDLKVPMCNKSIAIVKIFMRDEYKHLRDHMASFDLASDDDIEPALIEYSLYKDTP
jgi:glutaredoxin-related protein